MQMLSPQSYKTTRPLQPPLQLQQGLPRDVQSLKQQDWPSLRPSAVRDATMELVQLFLVSPTSYPASVVYCVCTFMHMPYIPIQLYAYIQKTLTV